MTSIEIERIYPHPPELVWRALTTRELLAEWLMENDFEPVVGHEFTFRTEPGPGFDGIVRCEVLELDAPGTDGGANMLLSWRGGPIDTQVRFTVQRVAGGSRLRMEQSGFKGLKAWLVSRLLKSGAKTLYRKKLPALLLRLQREENTNQ